VIVDEEKVNAGDQTRDDHQMIRIRKPMGETNRPEARSDRSESDSRIEFNEDEEEKTKGQQPQQQRPNNNRRRRQSSGMTCDKGKTAECKPGTPLIQACFQPRFFAYAAKRGPKLLRTLVESAGLFENKMIFFPSESSIRYSIIASNYFTHQLQGVCPGYSLG
jgi:hypothetical protein